MGQREAQQTTTNNTARSLDKGIRATRPALPPRAMRTANSWLRNAPFASSRLVIFAQVSKRIRAVAASKANSGPSNAPTMCW